MRRLTDTDGLTEFQRDILRTAVGRGDRGQGQLPGAPDREHQPAPVLLAAHQPVEVLHGNS